MKKTLLWLSVTIVFLTACGDNDEVNNPPQQDDSTDTTEEQDMANETEESNVDNQVNNDSPYSFTHFELDVDMEDDLDIIEVEYENEPDETEASYRDKNQGIDLAGDEAMGKLDDIFSTFEIDVNTPKEEVVEAVRSAFSIPEDSKRVEIEITYNDGTEVEFVD